MMARERVVDVWVPVGSGGSGFLGGVGAMAALFIAVVVVALLVLLAVMVAFPSRDYSPTPSTRTPGPCEPFCSLRTATAPADATGGVQR